MLLTTRKPDHIYKFLVLSVKHNIEKKLNLNKTELIFFKLFKFPSLKYLFFLIFLLLSGKLFSKNRANIKYKETLIGKFILAQTFQNFKAYISIYDFYKTLIKNFIKAGIYIRSAEYYVSKKKIKALYVDHCGGLNGILYSYFSNKKIIIYTNMYPSNIYGVDFRKNNKNHLKNFQDSIKVSKKTALNLNQKRKTKKLLKKLFIKPNYLDWMSQTKYKKHDKIKYNNFDYIVYAHSFTDDQLCYGFDGFENTLDWLNFTLDKLGSLNKKIIIKGHPNFYSKSLGILSIWDKKIFSKNKEKYIKNKNFYFIDKPIFNNDLLKKVDKKTILISHHGTVLFEGAQLGFKSICSEATMFSNNFKISNFWTDKKNYENLLNLRYEKLNYPNKIDLDFLIYTMFTSDYSYSGKYFWQNIIAKEIGIKSMIDWNNKIEIFSNTKNADKRRLYFKKMINGKEDKIISKISKNIGFI